VGEVGFSVAEFEQSPWQRKGRRDGDGMATVTAPVAPAVAVAVAVAVAAATELLGETTITSCSGLVFSAGSTLHRVEIG
jgi:hypothetical protein